MREKRKMATGESNIAISTRKSIVKNTILMLTVLSC